MTAIQHPRMARPVVLSLCDRSGVMVEPWVEAGCFAVTVDIQSAQTVGRFRQHYKADVMRWRYPDYFEPPRIVFAFPPCTDLARSGGRWFAAKGLGALIAALALVDACRELCEQSGAPWMLENPIGTLATYWREPDHTFDPCDYGDPYTKRTCLWTGGGFVMPRKVMPDDLFEPATVTEPTLGSAVWTMPDSVGRAERRALTPKGFARAVFEANAPRVFHGKLSND